MQNQMKKIMVADDLSLSGHDLVDFAADMAANTGADLEAVHVRPPAVVAAAPYPGITTTGPVMGGPVVSPPPGRSELEERVSTHIEDIDPARVRTKVTLLDGPAAKTLVQIKPSAHSRWR